MKKLRELLTRVLQWLTSIETDKYQHYAVGAALGAVALVAMKLLWLLVRQIETLSQVSPAVERWTTVRQIETLSQVSPAVERWTPLAASVIVVFAAAIIKERKVDAQADVTDIAATVLGGATVWVVFLIG